MVVAGQAGHVRQVQGLDDLAVDVQLELPGRAVADPDGLGALVAGQPVERGLGQLALAGDAVHDLQVLRVAGDGPQQPLAPGAGLVAVAGAQQRGEGDGGVAQPGVAVVPVALAADVLRQRGGGGGDDAAGGGVGEALEGDQGAHHGLPVGALVGALAGPLAPEVLGGAEHRLGVRRAGRLQVRGLPGEGEGDPLAGRDGEVGVRGEVAPVRLGLAVQPDRVGAGHGDGAVAAVGLLDAVHPGHDAAVAEAHPQGGAHPDGALQALDDPDDLGDGVAAGQRAGRHEVDHPDAAALGVPLLFEDQRVAPVAAAVGGHGGRGGARRRDPQITRIGERAARSGGAGGARRPGDGRSGDRFGGADPPEPVFIGPQQAGEDGRGVEAGKTQPVDRSVPADQGSGLHVPDECVVLDTAGHVDLQFARWARRDVDGFERAGSGAGLCPHQGTFGAPSWWWRGRRGVRRGLWWAPGGREEDRGDEEVRSRIGDRGVI